MTKKSKTLEAGAQLVGEGGRQPLPFFENQKKYPDLGKHGPNSIHRCVKFSIQNVLRVPRRKNLKIFLWGAFFEIMFIKVLKFHETSLALKIF